MASQHFLLFLLISLYLIVFQVRGGFVVPIQNLNGGGFDGSSREMSAAELKLLADNEGHEDGFGGGIGFGKITTAGPTTPKPTWRPPKGKKNPGQNDNDYQWPDQYYDDYDFETSKSIRLYGTFENKYRNYQAAMVEFYSHKNRVPAATTAKPKG